MTAGCVGKKLRLAVALAPLVLGVACNVTAPMLFRGEPPAFTGPRMILRPEELEQLDQRHNPLRRLSPYRRVSESEISACERAVWQRAHWSFTHADLPAYTMQYAGITANGEERVFVSGLCPREWSWHVERFSEEELRFPGLGGFHSGQCAFTAQCQPRSGVVYEFSFASPGRR